MINLKARQMAGPAVILALLLLLYFPVFRWMVSEWANSDYYSHGFLIIPVAGVIVWTRREALAHREPYPLGVWLLFSGLALRVYGFLHGSDFISGMSLFPVLAGLVLYFWGGRTLRALAFPLFFLIFMIPFPSLDRVGFELQEFSARWSARAIDVMGIDVVRMGAEIQLQKASFVVGLPCSGLNSVISLTALAAVFAYVVKGPFVRKVPLFLLAIPIAIFANILRLIALFFIADRWGRDTAMTFFHDVASPLFFAVAVLCLLLFSRLLGLRIRRAEG